MKTFDSLNVIFAEYDFTKVGKVYCFYLPDDIFLLVLIFMKNSLPNSIVLAFHYLMGEKTFDSMIYFSQYKFSYLLIQFHSSSG